MYKRAYTECHFETKSNQWMFMVPFLWNARTSENRAPGYPVLFRLWRVREYLYETEEILSHRRKVYLKLEELFGYSSTQKKYEDRKGSHGITVWYVIGLRQLVLVPGTATADS